MTALPPEPLYLPFEEPPFRLAMGLVARDPATLILLDEHYPSQIAQRRTILAEQGREVAALEPGAEPALAEMLARITDLLLRDHPGHFSREGSCLRNHLTGDVFPADADPLTVAALLVQEDLCLLALRDGVPHLVGGTLCFTPGWRLLDKLGLPLAAVHGPVPYYEERLARPVDRLVAHLKPGKLAERLNWGLYDSPALHRPARNRVDPTIHPGNAIDRIYLRVERQTLSPLERSGCVLFTIRTHVYPLRRVVAAPGGRARLRDALAALPPDMARYKTIAPFRSDLLEALSSET